MEARLKHVFIREIILYVSFDNFFLKNKDIFGEKNVFGCLKLCASVGFLVQINQGKSYLLDL
jgi:hypothetical protein